MTKKAAKQAIQDESLSAIRPASPQHESDRLVPPLGLRGKQFTVDGEEFAVLVLPLSPPPVALDSLTTAERAIVGLVLKGLANEEVASIRYTSGRTVANQLQAIYRKLGITSRVELAHLLGGAAR